MLECPESEPHVQRRHKGMAGVTSLATAADLNSHSTHHYCSSQGCNLCHVEFQQGLTTRGRLGRVVASSCSVKDCLRSVGVSSSSSSSTRLSTGAAVVSDLSCCTLLTSEEVDFSGVLFSEELCYCGSGRCPASIHLRLVVADPQGAVRS